MRVLYDLPSSNNLHAQRIRNFSVATGMKTANPVSCDTSPEACASDFGDDFPTPKLIAHFDPADGSEICSLPAGSVDTEYCDVTPTRTCQYVILPIFSIFSSERPLSDRAGTLSLVRVPRK